MKRGLCYNISLSFSVLSVVGVLVVIWSHKGCACIPGTPGDAQRRSDINTYVNAITTYETDHHTSLELPSSETEICQSDGADCEGFVLLNVLEDAYVVDLPRDPDDDPVTPGTGYFIMREPETHLMTVSAPHATQMPEGTLLKVSK